MQKSLPSSYSGIFYFLISLQNIRNKDELIYCMKSVHIRSFSDPCFPVFGPILCISPCSVWMWENTDQKNSEYGHFSCSDSEENCKHRSEYGFIRALYFDSISTLKVFEWNVYLLEVIILYTVWKVSKYGVFSGPYFPAFGPEKTPYLDTFHAVSVTYKSD